MAATRGPTAGSPQGRRPRARARTQPRQTRTGDGSPPGGPPSLPKTVRSTGRKSGNRAIPQSSAGRSQPDERGHSHQRQRTILHVTTAAALLLLGAPRADAQPATPACGDCHEAVVRAFGANPHARAARSALGSCESCHAGASAHAQTGNPAQVLSFKTLDPEKAPARPACAATIAAAASASGRGARTRSRRSPAPRVTPCTRGTRGSSPRRTRGRPASPATSTSAPT